MHNFKFSNLKRSLQLPIYRTCMYNTNIHSKFHFYHLRMFYLVFLVPNQDSTSDPYLFLSSCDVFLLLPSHQPNVLNLSPLSPLDQHCVVLFLILCYCVAQASDTYQNVPHHTFNTVIHQPSNTKFTHLVSTYS